MRERGIPLRGRDKGFIDSAHAEVFDESAERASCTAGLQQHV